jgi:hypothetical protein
VFIPRGSGVTRALAAVLAAIALAACQRSIRHLDEHVFLKTPEITLKLQRYFRSAPLSFTGETYVVLCGSPQTIDAPGGEDHPAGWRVIGRGSAIGSESARALAASVAAQYLVLPRGTVVSSYVTIDFALDACRRVVSWSPTTLPPSMLVPIERPEFCQSLPAANCAMLDFQGERRPRYSAVRVTPNGEISFRVHSRAFAGIGFLDVRSDDRGESWAVTRGDERAERGLPDAAAVCAVDPGQNGFGLSDGSRWTATADVTAARATELGRDADFDPATDAEGRVLAARADLTGDGVPEVIVRGAATRCGTGGCPFLVLDGDSTRAIGVLFGWRLWSASGPESAAPVVCAVSHVGAGQTSLTIIHVHDGVLDERTAIILDDDQLNVLLTRVARDGP